MRTNERTETQLTIGELARCAGVTSRAIRHYHATGLLPEPPRDTAGYRRYGPADLARLLHICRLRALGMPIDQIENSLEETPGTSTSLPAALLALAVDVDAEIDRLKGVHDRLIVLAESDEFDDAAELLSAGLRAGGLLDLDSPRALEPRSPCGSDHATSRFHGLLQRFRVVTHDEVEQLAQEFASVLPALSHRAQSIDLPMLDRLIGDRLNHAQRDCMVRLRALLQARSPAVGVEATIQH